LTSSFIPGARRRKAPGHRWRAGRRAVALGAATGAAALSLAFAPGAAQAQAQVQHAPSASELGPTVTHTGTGPTGYTVTFRIYDPSATSMRIKGEWSFASAAEIAADPTNSTPDYGTDWKPGDFPLASPNAGPAANWPVTAMTEDTRTGVWSYTTPLPSGVFSYAFYPDCTAAAPALTACTAMADPANPPWSSAGSAELTSQVYVPSDPRFGTEDLSWQSPAPRGDQGTLTHLTYSSPGHTDPANENYLAVYTPPGYNPQRRQAYPTFYLVHGGGGNEMDWTTQGDLKNILDNLIARGEIQPMVVVMPNNPTDSEMLDDIIPYVQQHFNVQTTASGRSFAGLSGGTTVVQEELFGDATEFGYYAVWSAPTGLPTTAQVQNPKLKEVLGLEMGVAKQDLGGKAQGNTTAEEALLTANDVPYRKLSIDGGHNWAFWRKALADFVTKVDFRTTSVTVTAHGRAVSASVTAATQEPWVPAGTVQFELNGKTLGRPVSLRHGTATIELPGHVGSTVTAIYSGDSVYNASTGTGSF
jgi:enterochelin esterase-like enzyme